MSKKAYLAFDLGAESGRAMLGVMDGDTLSLQEMHRFANRPQRLPDGLHWNLLDLWANLLEGLGKGAAACRDAGYELASLGVDTWGVDCAYIGRSGQLLGLPFAYRDERNLPAMEKTLRQVGVERLYDITGLQLLPFNTLFQLVAQRDSERALLDHAAKLAFMPDLLHYFFTGQVVSDATIASTSQMIDPRGGPCGAWAKGLLSELDLPHGMLGEIVPAGTTVGNVRSAIAAELGCSPVKVITPASHDTASAIAAVPADGSRPWCYISSGTWSLVGAELPAPLISEAARKANFTNERGLDGTVRFLRNTAGLWLVQQVRANLAQRGTTCDYAQLTDLARKAKPFATLVDPGFGPFLLPGQMIDKIGQFAAKTGQGVPADAGALVRCCLESLAMEYRRTITALESLLGREVEVVHVVGGGGRNELLNQMTADATGKPVVVGPYEATAAGNVLVQALGDGFLGATADIRRIVRRSFDPRTYLPQNPQGWNAPYECYLKLIGA